MLSQVGLREGLRLKGGLAPSLRQQLRDYIEQHLAEPISLGEVALACGFASASHFSNRFRQALGATPGQYRLALGR